MVTEKQIGDWLGPHLILAIGIINVAFWISLADTEYLISPVTIIMIAIVMLALVGHMVALCIASYLEG